MTAEELFFQLLQVAIGTRNTLDKKPTLKEWALLFELAKKQAVVAVAFAGVAKYLDAFNSTLQYVEDVKGSMTYLHWLGLTAEIVKRNGMMNAACVDVCKELDRDGFRCCVLKGQGNLEYYPEELREFRTSGDIDVWCVPSDSVSVVKYAKMRARMNNNDGCDGWYEVGYHHSCFVLPSGILVELHSRPNWLASPYRNYVMQKWFNKQSEAQLSERNYIGFPVPTVGFNVVYQLTHIFNHLMEEGVGLRQLLDYYMVLRAHNNSELLEQNEIEKTLSSFGLKTFAGAVMWVLHRVFAMSESYMICPANEHEGQFLLCEIMTAGNFGKYDERISDMRYKSGTERKLGQMKHAMRLLKHYPEETICTPFRVRHIIWRKLSLWRFE